MKNKVIFFGSGPVAAQNLEQIKDSFAIELVVTKSSTKELMSSIYPDCTVVTADNSKELDAIFTTLEIESSVAILVDYGVIVSNKIIDRFDKGIVNSHFSLLPELRGADPISFAILEGKDTTGVSLMLLVEKMDEGPILAQKEVAITREDTGPSLTKKLISISSNLLKEFVPLWMEDKISAVNQEEIATKQGLAATYTRKLNKSDGVIDWSKDAKQIEREVRAFIEWPRSHTILFEKKVIIKQAKALSSQGSQEVGVVTAGKGEIMVECGKGRLNITRLQPQGKKEMDAASFINGYAR